MRPGTWLWAWLLGVASIATPGPAVAESITTYTLAGSLRGGVWSTNRELEKDDPTGTQQLWAKGSYRLRGGFVASLDGRLSLENEDFEAEARTVTFGLHSRRIDVEIGRQLFAWGRADRFNPTDVVSPRDYKFLSPEEDDQRLGLLALRADVMIGNSVLTLAWIPEYRQSEFPLGPLPTGFSVEHGEDGFHLPQWAARLDNSGGDMDFALYWFHGKDRLPAYVVADQSPTRVDIANVTKRVDMVGADAARPIGGWNARGEVAFLFQQWPKPSASFSAVAGADRDFTDGININTQILVSTIIDDAHAASGSSALDAEVTRRSALVNNQLTNTQYGLSFRVGKEWLHDTVHTEIGAVQYFSDMGGALVPKLKWSATDELIVSAGANVFWGASDSFFGQLEDNTLGYMEVKWSF